MAFIMTKVHLAYHIPITVTKNKTSKKALVQFYDTLYLTDIIQKINLKQEPKWTKSLNFHLYPIKQSIFECLTLIGCLRREIIAPQ